MRLDDFLNNLKSYGEYPFIEIRMTDLNRHDELVYCERWICDSKITRDMLLGTVTGLDICLEAKRIVIHVQL